jgi:hypothetical protein
MVMIFNFLMRVTFAILWLIEPRERRKEREETK